MHLFTLFTKRLRVAVSQPHSRFIHEMPPFESLVWTLPAGPPVQWIPQRWKLAKPLLFWLKTSHHNTRPLLKPTNTNTRPFLRAKVQVHSWPLFTFGNGSGWETDPIRQFQTLIRISLRVLIKTDSQQKVGPLTCKQNYLIFILSWVYTLQKSGMRVELKLDPGLQGNKPLNRCFYDWFHSFSSREAPCLK